MHIGSVRLVSHRLICSDEDSSGVDLDEIAELLRGHHAEELAEVLKLTNEDGRHPGAGLSDLIRRAFDESTEGYHRLDDPKMPRRIAVDPIRES